MKDQFLNSVQNLNYNVLIVVLSFLYLGMVFFSMAIPNILLGAIIFVYILGVIKKKLVWSFSSSKKLILIALLIPFALTVISGLMSKNLSEGLSYIWLRLPIFVLPIILILTDFSKKHLKKGLKLFVFLCALASLIVIIKALRYFNEGILFETDLVHFITLIHHPYFGIFLLIALVSLLEFKLITNIKLTVLIISLFCVAIALTTSRLVYILFLVYGIYFIYKNVSRKWFFGLSGLMAILSMFFLNQNQALSNKFKTMTDYKKSPRLQLWDNAKKVVEKEDAYVFGIGIGDYYMVKEDNYFAKGRSSGNYGYNPHNQWIEFYVTNGVLGIVFCLIGLGILLFYLRFQMQYAVVLYSILFMFTLTECILDRQYGIQLFGVLSGIIFSNALKKDTKCA